MSYKSANVRSCSAYLPEGWSKMERMGSRQVLEQIQSPLDGVLVHIGAVGIVEGCAVQAGPREILVRWYGVVHDGGIRAQVALSPHIVLVARRACAGPPGAAPSWGAVSQD